MIEVSQVQQCKQLDAQGASIRAIAAELGLSRNTVRRYLRGAQPGRYQMKERRPQPRRSEKSADAQLPAATAVARR